MSRNSNLSSRIFVGGLNQAVDEVDLEKAFKLFGEITNVMVMRDKENGRSRGFAFISFKDSQSSEEAISRMHGVEIRGKCVSVRHAERTKYDKIDDRRSNDGGKLDFSRSSSGIMLSNLSYERQNFQPSDRVYVAPDDDQAFLKSYSTSDRGTETYRVRSPMKDRIAVESQYEGRLERFPERRGVEGRYHDAGDRLSSDRPHGQSYTSSRFRNEMEMSPAREMHNYISSRGRSFSPLLQLEQKLSSRTNDRDMQRGGFGRSCQSSLRHDSESYQGRHGSDDRRISEKDRNRRINYHVSESPDRKDLQSSKSSHGVKRPYDRINSGSREQPSRKNSRSSPIPRHGTRVDKRTITRSTSQTPLNNQWVHSHDTNYKERVVSHLRSPEHGVGRQRNYGGQFAHDFTYNGRNNDSRRECIDESEPRTGIWKVSDMRRDRRGSPPSRRTSDIQYSKVKRTKESMPGERVRSSQQWENSSRRDFGRNRVSMRSTSSDLTRNWDRQKFTSHGRSPPRRTQVSGRRY